MSGVFNVAKGKVGYYTELPGTNDALILVPLETSGLESEAAMLDRDTLADVLAQSTNEQTTAGRKTITSATWTVNDTDNRGEGDFADQSYSGGNAAGNAVSSWLVCYDPDTTGGDDSTIIPLTKHDLAWTPDGNTFTVQVADFVRSS